LSTASTTDQPLVFDPYDYANHEDPYPVYRRLRDEAPLYHNPDLDFWALSRHADVALGFRDTERFSNSHGVSMDPAAWGPHADRTSSFLAMDPPRHTRLRALVSRGFTPRRVAQMEDRVRALTREHLDPALGSGEFDFVSDLAGRIPMDVISDLIGVPRADRAELRRLADLLVHREEGLNDVPPAGVEAAFSLFAYYADMVAERRRAPTDDLTSALLDVEVEGDRMTEEEVLGFLFLMVVAGNETTTKLLANAWYWGWRNPDQRAKPLADRSRVADWVEETLRYDTSSQLLARITTCEVHLDVGTIPAGAQVALLAGSANRDDRVFPDPDRYDLDRDTTGILSFGMGRHFCLGAALARLEGRVVLEELAARIADYDVDPAGCSRVHSVNVRGFAALPTRVVPR
jgi:hypothetical protein